MSVRVSPSRPTVLTRFWAKVDDSGGPTACWPWRGAKTAGRAGRISSFYGVFCVADFDKGTSRRSQIYVRAHRFALVLATGIEPADQQACHDDAVCTTTLCCNPAHLRWGTDAENRADWKQKHGRSTASDAETMAQVLDELEVEGVIGT